MAHHPTVLIVDDHDLLRKILASVLSFEGYRTLEAVDGAQAVDILRQSPDRLVVLLDLKMPGMSGQDVLELVNVSEDLKRHVYIVVSVDKALLDLDHASLLTRHDIPFMEKSFTLDELLEEVARAASRLS